MRGRPADGAGVFADPSGRVRRAEGTKVPAVAGDGERSWCPGEPTVTQVRRIGSGCAELRAIVYLLREASPVKGNRPVLEPRHDQTVATVDLTSCAACGLPAEIGASFSMPGLDGDEAYVRTKCVQGHCFVGPEFALRQG